MKTAFDSADLSGITIDGHSHWRLRAQGLRRVGYARRWPGLERGPVLVAVDACDCSAAVALPCSALVRP